MIKTLAHVCLFSKDLNRSLDFYCGALGRRRHFDFIKDGELLGFYLRINENQFIEIFKAGAEEKAGGQRIHHLCLEVDDLDEMRAALIRQGVEVKPKKKGCDETWQFWCQNPDGTDVEFQQYTAQSSQLTRTPCVVDWQPPVQKAAAEVTGRMQRWDVWTNSASSRRRLQFFLGFSTGWRGSAS